MTGVAAASVLIVDDTPDSLRLLSSAVAAGGHRVRAATNGPMAIRMARLEPPDLILLDIDMPEVSGLDVCAELQRDPALRRVPVLFVTALSAPETKLAAFRGGGRDFVVKPFNIDEVLARVSTHLELRRLEQALSDQNASLQERVAAQVREISEAQMATIVALAQLSQSRDDTTGLHVERMGRMAECFTAVALRGGHSAADELAALQPVICAAAMLHDIGKVSIPDAILLKAGRLSVAEFEIMKTHAAVGAETLAAVLRSYPSNDFIRVGVEIARSHHERWSGGGYPDDIAGLAIPLSARLCAVVDIYDALRSARPYKVPLSHAASVDIVRGEFGVHLDPGLAAAFVEAAPLLDAIWADMQVAVAAPKKRD